MPKETNKKQSKEKKHVWKDFKAELKRVVWPTPKQLFNNTVAVISIVLLIAVIVFALDFTFEKMNTHGIEKIKTVVEKMNTAKENSTDESDAVTSNTNSEENTTANETANNNTVEK